MSSPSTGLLILPAEAGNTLLRIAGLEFQAALQLLADRACWVSGATSCAVAVEEHGTLQYCAVSGPTQHVPGTTPQVDNEPLRTCLTEHWTVRHASAGDPQMFSLAVPVLHGDAAIGFLELISEREFSEEQAEAASRTAQLVSVTLEHRQAAERAEKLEFRENELELPSLWHIPENKNQSPAVQGRSSLAKAEHPSPATTLQSPDVGTCAACGFPVSPGRALCVDCEQKPGATSVAKNLFEAEPHESWISAHGYTIASLVVTAITAAIILWLRH